MKKIVCNKNLIVITFLNIVMAMIALFVFVPSYETNDDFTMGVIASGNYGNDYSQFLVFTNLVYGYVLKFLGFICSSLNWYVVSQYILTLLSIISIMYILSKYTSLWVAVVANQMMWFISFFEMFRRVQFTRTSGLVAVAGCVLIWYSFKETNKLVRGLGIAFCVTGSFIRIESFPIAISFFCVLALVYAIGKKLSLKKIMEIGITIIIVVCISGAFLVVDKVYYNASDKWEGYTAYNTVRADLMDYGFPPYAQYADKYAELGFSQNDIAVIKRWMLADFEKFTYEDMETIAGWKEPQEITKETVKANVLDFFNRNYTNRIFWLWLMLILVSFILNNPCRIFAAANIGLVTVLYCYLYYIQRVLPRVEFVIWIGAVCSLIFGICSYYKMSKVTSKKTQVGIISGVLVFSFVFLGMKYNTEYATIQAKYKQQPRDILEKLAKNEDNIYLLDTPSFGTTCMCYVPYLSVPDYYLSNFYYMGGWDTESAFNKNQLKTLGLENPMKEQIYKDNVYFVKSEQLGVAAELLYLQENYNKNVDVNQVESYNGYGIYKFYIKE